MPSRLWLLFLSLPVLLASFLGTTFWLSIPLLLQVVIDKVLPQHSSETLSVVGVALLMTTLIASVIEIGINSLITALTRSHLVLKESFLHITTALTKALVILSVLSIYSPQIAIAASALTALACGSCYFLDKARIKRESEFNPLPLSFRLPLTLITLAVLWQGASLVLADQISLGQWLAIGILSLQLAATLLSFTSLALAESHS